ncbi:MAG: transcription termination factor NusA [Atopostipes suicloacalis]|nr:transcription termination factor NusA [Atopostipes suicloacalis]MDN6730760.1 transcription termination factor NusA [Atopostipes suicloacalis]
MSNELAQALKLLETEKGISPEVLQEALESALISAYRQEYGSSQNVEVDFNTETGKMTVYQIKEVVEEVENESLEISLIDAREKNFAYELGDKIKFEVTPKDFGRVAASTAKNVITQRLREEERTVIYNEYIEYENDLVTGIVERQDDKYVFINLGKVEAAMSTRNQIEGESYHSFDRIKVYVDKVQSSAKGPQVFVSRTHPDLVKRLFEQEVPEIYEGIVEIKSIAREAGDRSKLAVYSHEENVDAVGTCVGPKGVRVQTIVDELNGENMDIVEWDEDPKEFIKNSLNPADVVDVYLDEVERECIAVVPDMQLSLAIGRRGQNVRLAARLTGYKIDIKSESEFDPADLAKEEAEEDIEEEVNTSLETVSYVDELANEDPTDFFDSIEEVENTGTDEKEDVQDLFNVYEEEPELEVDTEEELLEEKEENPLKDSDYTAELDEIDSDLEEKRD